MMRPPRKFSPGIPPRQSALRALFLAVALTTLASGPAAAEPPPFPRVWTSFSVANDPAARLDDLQAHGVGAIEISRPPRDAPAFFAELRRRGLKIVIRFGEVQKGRRLPPDTAGETMTAIERPLMLAGAFNGKAIDRFRFPFAAGPHEVVIEQPIYHPTVVYQTYGHYYEGTTEPVRAEVLVKLADFDGRPHVATFPATLAPRDAHYWTMRFDLTGAVGDLDAVMLAVYWRSHAERGHFRDWLSLHDPRLHALQAAEVRRTLEAWRMANGGSFPSDLVCAARFGDENWYFSGHPNLSAMVSAPVWDYGEASMVAWRRMAGPEAVPPRGLAWADVFGRRAYATWMRTQHEAAARLVRVVKTTLAEEGLGNLPVFRNLTRADVFSSKNDRDGTGLDLLAREFDIVHLDPYPVRNPAYDPQIIPVDMAYASGLARRHGRWLVPWLQAHEYYPNGYFGLIHPGPDEVRRQLDDHAPFRPDALTWLGYGGGSTFPARRPDSWAAAGQAHATFFQCRPPALPVRFAVIRPYTVRALRNDDGLWPQDRALTETLLHDAVISRGWAYDPFEPLDTADLDPAELARYPLVIAAVGDLGPGSLSPFAASGVPCALLIEGADRFAIDSQRTGIHRLVTAGTPAAIEGAAGGPPIPCASLDVYELAPDVNILARTTEGAPVAWRVANIIFIAARPVERDATWASWCWRLLGLGEEAIPVPRP